MKKIVQYFFILLVIIIVFIVIHYLFYTNVKLNTHKSYIVKESLHAVALDHTHFYAIANNTVGKYSRKTGKRVKHVKLPFKHLGCGKIVNGDLLIVNNASHRPAVIWLDSLDLNIVDILEPDNVKGPITLLDWHNTEWWIGTGRDVFAFDPDWKLIGYWKLPKECKNNTGGSWLRGYLAIKNDKDITFYKLPRDAVDCKTVGKSPINFDGIGITFQGDYVWGVCEDSNSIIKETIVLKKSGK